MSTNTRWTPEQLDKYYADKRVGRKPIAIDHKVLKENREVNNTTMKDIPKEGKQVILGTCPSKSNCYVINTVIGRPTLVKTRAMKQYGDNFFIQCNQYRNANITGYFELHVDVYYPNQRADLDNSLKVVLDSLQRAKAIKNDNKLTLLVARKFLDKLNPRIEFEIKRA